MLLELLSGRWRLGEMSGRCQSVQSVHVNLAAVARGPEGTSRHRANDS